MGASARRPGRVHAQLPSKPAWHAQHADRTSATTHGAAPAGTRARCTLLPSHRAAPPSGQGWQRPGVDGCGAGLEANAAGGLHRGPRAGTPPSTVSNLDPWILPAHPLLDALVVIIGRVIAGAELKVGVRSSSMTARWEGRTRERPTHPARHALTGALRAPVAQRSERRSIARVAGRA